ncbi:hypothetical protein ACKWTF_005579 [Chironomus riparius]
MITSPVQHLDENDDEDLDMLRKIAMESLKRGRENEFPQEHQFQNVQPVFPNQQDIIPYENNEVPFQNGPFPTLTRPHRMPGNPHFMRPRFNNFGPRHPIRPFMQRGMPHRFPPQPIIPDFVPIPHVNPQFLNQQPPQPQIFPPVINEFPLDYVPTPVVRLSPRSAEFIAANEQAMKKASSKRYSRSPPPRRRRSRSGSPIRRRSRTRSPYKRRSPNENISRKRYRSKSPENRLFKSRNNSPKVDKRSKSPQNRSQSPRNARFARRGRDNNRFNNGSNGNGRYNRKKSESDKEDEKPEQNLSQSKPKDESIKVKEVDSKEKIDVKKEVKITKTKSLTPAPEEKSTTPPLLPTKKEKTEQELEDELLASTDEEDGDQLDINMDDNELDFLNDDSESENEGRFKSKPSANVKSSSTIPSRHNFGNSRAYDRGKYSSSRHDYKRDDKYSHSRRRDHANRRNTPDLDSRRKSPTDRKPIVSNKDKDDVKSSTESERKPMFKSTFKSIDSAEKKAESTATKKSDSRPALVRSYVNKPDVVVEKSSVKSVITLSEESSSKTGKRKIMERLGEFVGAKGKNDGNRSRASKQV